MLQPTEPAGQDFGPDALLQISPKGFSVLRRPLYGNIPLRELVPYTLAETLTHLLGVRKDPERVRADGVREGTKRGNERYERDTRLT